MLPLCSAVLLQKAQGGATSRGRMGHSRAAVLSDSGLLRAFFVDLVNSFGEECRNPRGWDYIAFPVDIAVSLQQSTIPGHRCALGVQSRHPSPCWGMD